MNKIENVVIKSVSISNADHGLLTMFLHLEGEHIGIGFGGYQLFTPKSRVTDETGFFIWRVLEVVGVSDVSQLEGKIIRIEWNNTGQIIKRIGNALKDSWFNPSEEMN